MEHEYIGWSAMIIPGAILGLFFRPKVSGIIVFSVLVLSVVGSIGAAFLQLIKTEWLLLLMGALPIRLPTCCAAI